MWIFLNEQFVPEEDAKVSVFDHGFLYGDGLFETFRAYNGQIFALSRHLTRFSNAARQLQLSIPDRPLLEQRLRETLERNNLKNAVLRLTFTRGENQHPLRPDLCKNGTWVITARPFSGMPDTLYEQGVRAEIVTTRRVTPTGAGAFIKSLNFLNNILAKLEINPDETFEAIFLNPEEYLSEGATSNLFWVKDNQLYTPSPQATILEGVTRDIICTLAQKNGLKMNQGLYLPESLFNADEAFLTNTGIEVMPLVQVSGHAIGSGKPGQITGTLHQGFKNRITENIEHKPRSTEHTL